MIPYRLHREAEEELYAAAAYYEDRMVGLGVDFIGEVERAIRWVRRSPDASQRWPDIPPELGVRRKLLDRFPFGLAYLQASDRVAFLAIAHLSRAPGYWLSRADDYK